MKEASGELSMTAIAVVAIAAIAGIFYTFVWPMIQASIVQKTCNTMGDGYRAEKISGYVSEGCFGADEDDAGGSKWQCCPPGKGTNAPKDE